MSRYMKKQITCKCCGQEYQGDVLLGLTTFRDYTDLDTNPHEPAVFNKVIQCPKCGYSTMHYQKDVNNAVKDLVAGEEYRELWRPAGADADPAGTGRIAVKLRCAEYLAEKQENYGSASYYALLLLWHCKEIDAEEHELKEVRSRALRYFEEYLSSNYDLDAAMILIDLLRQAKRFDDAMETVCSLEPYITNHEPLKKVAALEKQLIHSEDCSDHKMSEVGA